MNEADYVCYSDSSPLTSNFAVFGSTDSQNDLAKISKHNETSLASDRVV